MEPLTYQQIVTAAIALVAVIVSLISLRRTTRIQEQQLRLQKKQEELTDLQKEAYFGERRIAIKAEVDDDSLVLRPFGSDQDISDVTIYFPRKMGVSPVFLTAPDLRLIHARIAEPMRDYWDSQTTADPGQVKVWEHLPIPVVIQAHGHTKGVAVVSTGAYDLYSQYVRQPNGSSQLKIKGLSLNNYWPPVQDAQVVVDHILESVESAVSAEPGR